MHQFMALSLFDAGLEEVLDEAFHVLRSSYRRVPCDLFPLPNQEGTTCLRATLWSPAQVPERTAFMGHLSDGWYTMTNILAARLKVETLQIRATPPDSDRYVCSFNYWADGIETRTVYALDDDPWCIFQRGEALPVEDPDLYRKRRVRDRVTATYLAELAAALGWPVAAPAFWQPKDTAVLVTDETVGRP